LRENRQSGAFDPNGTEGLSFRRNLSP
jgi:hypothetical protein